MECKQIQFHTNCLKDYIKEGLKSITNEVRIKCPKCGSRITYEFLKSIRNLEAEAKNMLHLIFINSMK